MEGGERPEGRGGEGRGRGEGRGGGGGGGGKGRGEYCHKIVCEGCHNLVATW